MQDNFTDETLDAIRVISEPEVCRLVNVSSATWARMRQRGETPPKVQISRHRIGYRLIDVRRWLEARLVSSAMDPAKDPKRRWNRREPAAV